MKRHAWVGSLAAVVLTLACQPEQVPAAALPPGNVPPAIPEAESLNALGRSLARAIADPSMRSLLYEELRRSPLKEGKLHLQTFLQGAGAPLREAMALAASESGLSQALGLVGSVELYLPVKEHRQRWAGGSELIVATQWDEDETPVGVDLEGRPVSLSLEAPPEAPTLVLVPAEAFDENGVPYEKPARQTIAFNDARAPGLWINAVHVNHGRYESWPRGDPEFELYLEYSEVQGRPTRVCVDEDIAVEPYRWDMNGDWYFSPFLLAGADLFPPGPSYVIAMWEDDDGRCKIKNDVDFEKETQKILDEGAVLYKLIKTKDLSAIGLSVFHMAMATRNIIKGNDDYVGTSGVQEYDASHIATEPVKTWLLSNDGTSPSIWLYLQWKEPSTH